MATQSDGRVVITIEGDSGNFEQQLDRAAQSALGLSREAVQLGKSLEKTSSSAVDVSKNVSGLAETAEDLRTNVVDVSDALKEFEDSVADGAEKGEDLNSALENNARKSRELASEIAAVTSAFDKSDVSQENLAAQMGLLADQVASQREELWQLNQAYDQAREELTVMADAAKKAVDANGEGSAEAQEAADAYNAQAEAVSRAKIQLDEAQASMNSLEQELANCEDKMQDAAGGAQKLGDETEKAKQEADEAAESLKNCAVAAGAIAAALIAAGVAAVNASTKFDAAFAQTQTIMDTTKVSVDAMRQDIMDLSATSGMAATDVAEAVYSAISGSVDTADAANFVNQANQLSVAGFTSLSNATDVLTTSLNAYGLSADYVEGISNVLIQTQNLGKTTVDALASSMGRAISTGSAYGVNLENLSTAYVELTRVGIDTAEATTYLSSMLTELGDSGSAVGEVLQEKTGKSFGELMQDGWSLADVLGVLSDSVDGNAEALMGLWGSQEAGKASNAIVKKGLEDFNLVLRQMEDEMQGATSTTRDAYNTMTNTSEFIDTRFKNSLTNLGIAAGDQLRPALDAVKGALTDVIETGTEIINDCPVLTAGLTGVATASGALAIAIGGLMVAQKAKAAIDALNISLAANPAIFIASAVIGLGTALVTFVSNIDSSLPSVDELTTAVSGLGTTIADAKTECDTSVTSVTGAADAARNYTDRLAELEAQGLKTEAAQTEYRMTVDALNAVMPELNVAIDEQTGLVKGGTNAIYEHIDALKEQAIAEAMYEQYKATIEAYADATAELYTNEAKRNMLQKDADDLEGRLSSNREKQTEIMEKMTDVTKDSNLSYKEASAIIAEYQAQLDLLVAEEWDLEQSLQSNQKEQDVYNDAIEESNEKIAENQAAVDEATAAYAYYQEQLGVTGDSQQAQIETTQAQTEATQAQTDATAEYAAELAGIHATLATYGTAFADAGISIDAFSEVLLANGVTANQAADRIDEYRDRVINDTDAISQKSMADLETLISNMQQRTEAYKSWNDNLSQLQVQYGDQLSSEFMAYVRSLGPEYNAVLEDWLGGSTDTMYELQDSVAEGGEVAVACYAQEYGELPVESERISEDTVQVTKDALDPMVDTLGDTGADAGEALITGTQDAVDQELPALKQYAGESGQETGYEFSAGTADGIRDGEYLVTSAARDVARAAVDASRRELQINSPSKVGRDDVGIWYPAGMAEGVEMGTDAVVDAVLEQDRAMVQASQGFLRSAQIATRPTVAVPAYYADAIQAPAIYGSARLKARIEIPLYLDGREVARRTAQYMGEQMEFEVM